MTARRDGFTVVELVIVLLFVGVLARIAAPAYTGLVYQARAAQALGDIQTVKLAAYSYNADTNQWPADVYPGEVPPELVEYLGEDFSFQRRHYDLDWENWAMPDGSPKHPDTGVLLGISLTTSDPKLGAALEVLVGSDRAHFTLGDNYTFVIASL